MKSQGIATTAVRGMKTAEVLNLPAMVTLDTANCALNIGRTVGFTLARTGKYPVPVHKLGTQYRVARADLLRILGIEETVRSDAA